MPIAASLYPPVAFSFCVTFGTQPADGDAAFNEVGGIGPEFETEALPEGGENRYTLQVPKAVRYPKLTLKRGVAPLQSGLVTWCKAVLEGGLVNPVVPKLLHVFLLDEKGEALRAWSFQNAWPVRWEVGPFQATRNEVAMEKIELSYAYSVRER